MPRLRNEVVSGFLLLVFAIAMHLYIIPNQVEYMREGPIALCPSLFCHITAFLLLILSCSLIASGLRKGKVDAPLDLARMKNNVVRGGIALILSALYIMAISFLGYFVSTIFFMVIFLWFAGVRSWKGGIVFMIVIIPFIYLLFVKALQVVLPTGWMV